MSAARLLRHDRAASFRQIPSSRTGAELHPNQGCRKAEFALDRRHMTLRPFHLAFPVHDLAAARHFWGDVMGSPEGRSSDSWIDFDFYGHQIVAHCVGTRAASDAGSNPVDGHGVPVPHFGIVLSLEDWQALADRLTAAGTKFEIEPYIRFKGEPGEQATMFFRDPSGNAIEMKAFADLGQLFAK